MEAAMKNIILMALGLAILASPACKGDSSDEGTPGSAVTQMQQNKYSVTTSGCVEGNCTDGTGTMIQPNGNKYTGQFKNGKPNGSGTAYWSISGDTYNGTWKDDMMHGIGTYTFGPRSQWSGDTYTGGWYADKMHGTGTYTFGPKSQFAGDKYVGGYKNGKKSGTGTYFWTDGNKYVGGWMDDCMHGRGVFSRKDGTVLKGTWRFDEYTGK